MFEFEDEEDFYILGSSIGGGSILVTDINGNQIQFSGDYPTLIIKYSDQKGVISKISSILSTNEINIATMKVTREDKVATMVVETDTDLTNEILEKINQLEQILYIKGINPIER